ncbi:MAG: hypothetical protein AAGF30_03150 [Pseudomonadota bacterium]
MIRPLLLTVCIALTAAPVAAQQRNQGVSQLATSLQKDLDFLGFEEVDAQSLSLRQLGAIRSVADDIGFGKKFIDARFRVQAILRTDGFTTFDGTRVEGTRQGRY